MTATLFPLTPPENGLRVTITTQPAEDPGVVCATDGSKRRLAQ